LVLDENLVDALNVLADVVRNPLLRHKDLENEKRIVFEEIRHMEDSPEDLCHELFLEAVYGHDSLGRPILGTFDSVAAIHRSDLLQQHETCYAGNRLVVAAAGRLRHDRIVDLVNERFHDIEPGMKNGCSAFHMGSESHRTMRSSVGQTHVCTGSTAYAYDDVRKYPLIVLHSLLGGGMGSRLFQNLREKRGLAYSVYSFVDFWRDTGVFGVYVGCAPGKATKVVRLVEKELKQLTEKSIPRDELERVKSQLSRSLLLSQEDTTSRMHRLARLEAYTGGFQTVEEIVAHVASVTRDTAHEVAEDVIADSSRYTAVVEPE
jgi:predicted Zn-dependent peptidase